MEENVQAKIKHLIAKHLAVPEDQVTPDAKIILDLGADSLDTIELVMVMEEEFGIDIPDAEAEKLQTVQDVVDLVGRITGDAAPAAA